MNSRNAHSPSATPAADMEKMARYEKLEKVAGKTGGALGSGGMYSKVMAAKQAAESQTISNIAWGREKDVLTRIYQGEYIGTLIHC